MSEENVAIVRAAFGTFNAEGIDAAIPFFGADAVWYTTDRWVDSAAYRGHDGIRALVAAWLENFDDLGYDVREVRDAQDRVVALVHMTGRIKGTDSPISQPLGLVVSEFRSGTFAEVRAFASWDEALSAAGLDG